MKLLAVVVPAKDEEATIGELLDRVAAVGVPGFELRAFVVDDGSTDETAGIALKRGATVVGHAENRGLGAALRTGLRAAVEAGAAVIAYVDADLEYHPEDIPRLVEPILNCRADYVLGSRFMGAERRGAGRRGAGRRGVRQMKAHRKAGNRVFTALVALLTGRAVTDGQTGMRAFSREAAARAEIIHDYNHAQVLTLDLVRKGFALEEVPIRYSLREHGDSFVCWRYPAKVLPAIWRELRSSP